MTWTTWKPWAFCIAIFSSRLVHSDRIAEGLLETVQIALVSTCLVSRSFYLLVLHHHFWLLWPTRMILNVIRTIPFTLGIIGSGHCWIQSTCWSGRPDFYSVGYLAKFFSETFGNDQYRCSKTLRSRCKLTFQYGLWPNARPLYGAIAYGCSNTMFALPALLDMWVPVVSVYLKLYAESGIVGIILSRSLCC